MTSGEQIALVRQRVRAPRPPAALTEVDPVARVAVDVPLAHLDRVFDYGVPEDLADAGPGTRVRVRFAGQLVNGWVLERVAASEHEGRLAPLQRLVSPDPVLAPEVVRLARAVADHYGGTLADVLRLAVPPRHASAEKSVDRLAPVTPPEAACARGAGPVGGLSDRDGVPPRPHRAATGPRRLECAPRTRRPRRRRGGHRGGHDAGRRAGSPARGAGRPGRHAIRRIPRPCPGPGAHVQLSAELGPAERYRRFLRIRRGHVRVVLGTRAAMFAPVADLGLAVVWDDGDDLHAEQHAPYPHVREVLAMRSRLEGSALLIGGYAVTAEAAALVESGWAHAIRPTDLRSHAPALRASGDDAELARDEAARTARLPALAWRTAREALKSGPVLVQVPRRGYLPSLACVRCREPARCATCSGPLALTSGHAIAHCRWCGRAAGDWACPECGSTRFRAQVVGAMRTAEELGRAFPGVRLVTSGRDGVLDEIPAEPALVVATPGAEPRAVDGYAAALLLDGWALLDRPDLRAGEEALRRWLSAAALVRPAAEGGKVVIVADSGRRPVQGLLRWDPWWASARELADRQAVHLPPDVRLAEVTGTLASVEDLLAVAHLPKAADVLGAAAHPGASRRPDQGARPDPGAVAGRQRPGRGAARGARRTDCPQGARPRPGPHRPRGPRLTPPRVVA